MKTEMAKSGKGLLRQDPKCKKTFMKVFSFTKKKIKNWNFLKLFLTS